MSRSHFGKKKEDIAGRPAPGERWGRREKGLDLKIKIPNTNIDGVTWNFC